MRWRGNRESENVEDISSKGAQDLAIWKILLMMKEHTPARQQMRDIVDPQIIQSGMPFNANRAPNYPPTQFTPSEDDIIKSLLGDVGLGAIPPPWDEDD